MANPIASHPEIPIISNEVVQFTQMIVRQPSVTGEEGKLGRFLARALDGFGLQVTTQETAPGRYNVRALLPGTDPRLGLLFHSHMDTVPFGAMSEPLSAEVSDGHIWGRGSVDQKGGLAASVMALAAIARSGISLDRSLGLALVIDEESEHRGSMALVEEMTRSGSNHETCQAVVTEPSSLRLVIGCKGTTPYQIRVLGKAAHGCRPWLGVNAVHGAVQVVTALDGLDYAEYTVPGYGPVKGSLNLGVIQGGRAYNIVPDECAIWFDRRTVPGETQEEVLQTVQDVLDCLASGDPPVESVLRVARPDWDWPPIQERGLWPAVTPLDAPIREMVKRHHKPVMVKYVYDIASYVDLPVVGVGGVNKAEDVVEVTMVGATVVGMVAAPLLRGLQVFDQVEMLLRVYLAGRKVADINDLRGLTHQRIAEAEQRHDARAVIDPDQCSLCYTCSKVCFKQAPFVANDTMRIDAELCVGCGLCVSVCPDEAIALV